MWTENELNVFFGTFGGVLGSIVVRFLSWSLLPLVWWGRPRTILGDRPPTILGVDPLPY